MSAALSIHVIDPLNRTGKVSIPAHLVTDTKGLDDYRVAAAKREQKDFSLCLLFQKGRCNAGSRCHQVHASPEYVAELRAQAAASKNCCAEHGDLHSQGYNDASQTIVLVAADGSEKRYHLACFARTSCLDTVLRSVKSIEVRVPAAKMCRLHAQRRCKFGKDCKNVHLCPDAEELPVVVKGCPSIDMSCGISCRSVISSKPQSLSDSPNTQTPRCDTNGKSDAPLCVDAAQGCCDASATADGSVTNGCSSFFFSDEKVWGSGLESSMALDMSAFEATIRSLCADLDRAECSPASALRVRSHGDRLFAECF